MKSVDIEDIAAHDLTTTSKRNFRVIGKSRYFFAHGVDRLSREIHLVEGLK